MGWHLLQSYIFRAETILLDLQSNGVMFLLRNYLHFLVTNNYFLTFKIPVTSNCNGTVAMKIGQWIKSSELVLQVMEVTLLRYFLK